MECLANNDGLNRALSKILVSNIVTHGVKCDNFPETSKTYLDILADVKSTVIWKHLFGNQTKTSS